MRFNNKRMMINLIFVTYFLCLSYCLDCALDKDTFLLNETLSSQQHFTISNRGSQNVSIYMSVSSFYVPDNSQYRLKEKSSVEIKIRLTDKEVIYNGENIPIYCYDVHNPDDNQVLNIKVVNENNLCTSDSFEIVEGECNDDSYMTVSYRYRENETCIKIPLPQNETARCYNVSIMKASAITLYVLYGIISLLWFYTVFNVVKLFWIYLQYLPPHFIVGYALGTALISVYEAARTFVDHSSNCLAILIIGTLGHTLHSTCACATATYMYYEKMKTLKIKNNWLYLSIRLSITLVLESIAFGIGYYYYYGYGRNVELLSGLTYTIPFCDSSPLCIIYALPAVTWLVTIHYYTMYNIRSQSSTIYVFQIWRIGLGCIMITYYLMEMFLSEDLFQGKERLLFAITVNIAHIASHGIFYPLGLEVKDENLRPQLETHILTDDIYRECFRLYLSQDRLDHFLSFWEDCQTFKKFTNGYTKRIMPMLEKIVDTYLINKSHKRIKLPTEIREEIMSYYNDPNDKDGALILDKAIYHVYNILEGHFRDFLKSKQSYYVDIPYKWLHDFTYFHPALQYAVRIRMCENAVTDKTTGFSYQMAKGRLVNTNSCFQLADVPQIFGSSVLRRDNVKTNMSGMNPIDLAHLHDNNNNNKKDEYNADEVEVPRDNIYIPQTCMNNETGGITAYGFATLGDAGNYSDSSSVKKGCSGNGSLKVTSPTNAGKADLSPF